MNILGINWGEHDSAATLLQDGHLVAAVEEERLSRVKHAPFAFPARAARWCLEVGGVEPADVDVVAYSFSPTVGLGRGLLHAIQHFPSANFVALAELARRTWYVAPRAYAHYELKIPARTRTVYVPHHLAHAASAYYLSPFDHAAVLVVDGMGEWPVTSLYEGRGNALSSLDTVSFPHSLGFYYSAFTEYLGFDPFDGEYKVMGLAAYGEPRFAERFLEILRLPVGPQHRLDLRFFNFHRDYGRTSWYSPYMEEVFGPRSTAPEMPAQIYADLAASVQQRLEDAILHLARHLHRRTGLPDLCMAGGVGLNSVANGKVVQQGPFERVFIQPAANDAGCAVGAALYVHHVTNGVEARESLRDVYLGPEFGAHEIEAQLHLSKIAYETLADPAATAARLVAEGQIVGWFQGRMEFGPRALGNRSILADPRRASMKERINAAVKFREPFRPFAPSVPLEHSDTYFESVGASPYMLRVTPVKPGIGERLPAITHVNGTARLHTVTRESNPLYYDLLVRLGEQTGVPVVLNTSFNVRGEPIVCTPRDALGCFFSSGLDALVIDHFLIRKDRASQDS